MAKQITSSFNWKYKGTLIVPKVFLIFLCFAFPKLNAQPFITQWEVPLGASTISIFIETSGNTSYSWTCGTQSGNGTWAGPTNSLVSFDINILEQETLTLSIGPDNLRRFYTYGNGNYTPSRMQLIGVIQWGSVQWSSMETMFGDCTNLRINGAFEPPDLSNVSSMYSMFFNCRVLNGPENIGDWNTSNVRDMDFLFANAQAFNQPLGTWNTSNVNTMNTMFFGALTFNQPIGNWNTSSVRNMGNMFTIADSFNQALENWNVSNVNDMSSMFQSTIAFNQSLSNWQLNPGVDLRNMLSLCGMDCTNYSSTLIGWAQNNPGVTGRSLGASNMLYGNNAINDRNTLINLRGWTIAGDSPIGTLCLNCSVTATSTAISTTCGQANGSATATPVGGTGYTYIWSNGGSSQTINNLSAGTYTVTVTSSDGCSASTSVVVDSSTGITSTVVPTHTTCGLSNGSAVINPSGGNGYLYNWSNGGNTQAITNLPSGTYTVTVTSGNGCSGTASINVNGSTEIITYIVPTHTTCGLTNGSATANPSGGNGYSYNWSNGGNTQTITNVPAGTYTVTVTGGNGCSGIASIIVNGSTEITTTIFLTHTTCGLSNGNATIIPVGGNGYTYIWSNGESTQTINNLSAGIYNVTVTDLAGCSAESSVTINATSGIMLSLNIIHETCNGCNDGEITVSSTGGSGNYTFLWTDGSMAPTISNLSPGNYEITVMDSNGCIATASVDVKPFDCPIIEISVDILHPPCLGKLGVLTAIPNGGTAPYEFIWDSGEISSTISAPAGTYSVTVTDVLGCQAVNTAIVFPGEELSPIITGDSFVCFGEAGSLGLVQIYDDYMWSTGETTASILWNQAGDYTVTVTKEGCVGEARVTVAINIEFVVTIIDEVNILRVELQGGVPPFTYSWNIGSTADFILPDKSGIYSITVTDGVGCVSESTIEFTLNQGNAYFAPDAFSPNADGINDVWGIFLGTEFVGIETIEIFDRWGNVTCRKSNMNITEAENIWDGTILSGNFQQNIFVYTAQLKHASGSIMRISGEISIIY